MGMKTETIEKLYAKEKRDPWSIKKWLLNLGFDSETIDIALTDHARLLATRKRFGYKNGISLLSTSIRKQVADLTAGKIKMSSETKKEYLSPDKIDILKDMWRWP